MKLIKLNTDHYVIVDDSEIKEGDWILMNNCIIRQCDYVDGYMIIDTTQGKHHNSVCKKITHSTQPLEWFGGEIIFLSEVKELIGEVDVEKKVRNEIGIPNYLPTNSMSPSMQGSLEFGIKCYNQALEDNKEKKYTEEDMRKAWNAAYIDAMYIDEETYKPLFFEDFIQSLQPKTEWEVEFIDGKLTLKNQTT